MNQNHSVPCDSLPYGLSALLFLSSAFCYFLSPLHELLTSAHLNTLTRLSFRRPFMLLHFVTSCSASKIPQKGFPFLAKSFLSDLLQNHVSHILSYLSVSLLFNFFLAFFFYVDQRDFCSNADGDVHTSSAFSYGLAP